MNKRVTFFLAGAALLVCVVALFVVGPRGPDSNSESRRNNEVFETAPASAPAPATAPAVGRQTPAVRESVSAEPLAAPAREAAVPMKAFPTPAGKEFEGQTEDPSLSDDKIAATIKEKGGDASAYLEADPTDRPAIIGFLARQGRLRDALPALLAHETDSALRAQMIAGTVPRGYFDQANAAVAEGIMKTPTTLDPSEVPTRVVDQDLQDLLEQTPSTSMIAEEWMARIDLAAMIDNASGLAMARKARESGPDDAAVRIHTSTVLLALAQDDELDVTEEERQWAVQSLYSALGPGTVDADQRIRAYYALLNAPDREEVRQFFAGQRNEESDPKVRQALDLLIERLEGRVATPGHSDNPSM